MNGSVDIVTFIVFGAITGLQTMILCLAMLHFYQTHVNFASERMKSMGKVAYLVFIIHPIVVVPLCLALTTILECLQHSRFKFVSPDDPVSSTHNPPWWLLLIAFVVTSVISQLIVWPLASLLRSKVPGLSRVV